MSRALAWLRRTGARCLSGVGDALELAARAHPAALVVTGLCVFKGHCTDERALSFRRAPTVGRASCALKRQPTPRFLRGAGTPELAVSGGGGAVLKLAARARRVALFVIRPWRIQGHCLGERRLSFGARPWCDVPAVASNTTRARTHARPAAARSVRPAATQRANASQQPPSQNPGR